MTMFIKYNINQFAYSNNKSELILEDVCFSIKEGEKVEIAGENGVGKTTLLNLITGVIDNDLRKYARIYENDIENKNINLKSIQSFVPDTPQLLENLNMEDNVQFFSSFWKEERKIYSDKVAQMFKIFHLERYTGKLIRDLSLGTKQKIFISLMLCRKAKIYILDEPFNALDLESQKNLVNYINNDNKAYIIVSHINSSIVHYDQQLRLNAVKRK